MTSSSIENSFLPTEKCCYMILALHLFPRNIQSRWFGPYVVVKVFSHEAVKIRDRTNDQVFKVNRHGLKLMLELSSEEDMECIFPYEPLPSK